ncbi:MAG: pantetheine-phosphate adenylyltransferase [Bacteroidales bacterium]|nr:pantetheine-phosphate adenylyltransferase [Bacteroidales bacterium]
MNSKRVAIFPGSFDPITKGHESVVLRALTLFDDVIIAIGENSSKKGFFPIQQRLSWIRKTFEDYPNVKVEAFSSLLVDFCKEKQAKYILRGLRNSIDFQYERNIALINQELNSDIETIFLLTKPEDTAISSSFVREILLFGGDVTKFIPSKITIEPIKYL